MTILTTCPICDGTEFHNLDYLRDYQYWFDNNLRFDEPIGFKICKGCGFVTYDATDPAVMETYYNNIRGRVTPQDLILAERKKRWVHKFLGEVSGKVLDIGCGIGFLGALFREYTGTEWSSGYRAWARLEYGLDVVKEIDPQPNTYDILIMYRSLEHMYNPHLVLADLKKCLRPEGLLLISVPRYFDQLEEAGGGITGSFERLYQPDHVNVMSYNGILNLLSKCGFDPIKINTVTNGVTMLCKPCEPKGGIMREDWQERVTLMEKQKKAIELANQQKFDEAIAEIPNYPDAYVLKAMQYDQLKDFEAQMKVLNEGLKQCPGNVKIRTRKAVILLQWDEQKPNLEPFMSNNLRLSEELWKEILHDRENEEAHYYLALINSKYKKDYLQAVYHLKQMMEINPTKWTEGINLVGYNLKEHDKAHGC